MKKLLLLLIPAAFLFAENVMAQCPDCGNGVIDVGETTANCPEDIAHNSTCTSPCGSPAPYESTVGIRVAQDFTGTTTFGASALPAGWTFASGPSATTSGTLAAAGTDAYGAKAGLVQPNCSGSCTSTNGFCIGNIANSVAVGGGGVGGKLGANFDGRTNTNQNLSYAVLRGQGNPTLVSPNFDMSAVEGFKVQFWLCASESSCGQTNGWGSCVGNTAYLDFSSNGGTSWTQIMILNNSSSNSDMCTNNTSNTFWIQEGTWSRVCLTVYKTSSSQGNFYTAASGTTAPSGIMVNSAYFTSTFKFRIRYSQTASCTSGISATNPGRYLAIDYPVVTSGNQLIPCGISFINMCGYGADNNDDGVGSTATTNTIAYSTVRRSMNQAERGVEILTSQDATFASQNLSGSTFATNYDLCNAEGGDRQCIDWRTNNNFYNVVYECLTDWEAPTGDVKVTYYKNSTPSSLGLTKVTAVGKTPTIGWRYSGSRFVSCGSTSDLNPGCNGYLFTTNSLPNQFIRAFYGLATNSLGQSWQFYGPTSCSNFFNGPFFAPISSPSTVSGAPNYVICSGSDLVFTGAADYCSSSAFVGSPTLSITGPGGFTETITSGGTGTVPVTIAGDYTVTASSPTSPAQCIDCKRTVCVTVTQAEIDNCASALPVVLNSFKATASDGMAFLQWTTESEQNSAYFFIERSEDGIQFETIGNVEAAGNSSTALIYGFIDEQPLPNLNYYRLRMTDINGNVRFSSVVTVQFKENRPEVVPNPTNGHFEVRNIYFPAELTITDLRGDVVTKRSVVSDTAEFDCSFLRSGIYLIRILSTRGTQNCRLVIE